MSTQIMGSCASSLLGLRVNLHMPILEYERIINMPTWVHSCESRLLQVTKLGSIQLLTK